MDGAIETPGEPVTRRAFMRYAWAAAGALAGVEVLGIGFTYLQPRVADGQFGSVVSAGLVDDFPPGSVTHITNGRFFVVRLDDGGFLALYQKCTHLGCTVPWDPVEERFICPCHNSQFLDDGSVLNPPAPRPLDLFSVVLEEGAVQVDTSTPIVRDAFTADQVVYP